MSRNHTPLLESKEQYKILDEALAYLLDETKHDLGLRSKLDIVREYLTMLIYDYRMLEAQLREAQEHVRNAEDANLYH